MAEQDFKTPSGIPSGNAVRKFADQAADTVKDTVKGTANYFRNNSVQDFGDDIRKYVVAHPGPAILGAVAIGFFAGRMMRRM